MAAHSEWVVVPMGDSSTANKMEEAKKLAAFEATQTLLSFSLPIGLCYNIFKDEHKT